MAAAAAGVQDEGEEAAGGEGEVGGEEAEAGEMVAGAKADMEEATVEAREAATSIESPCFVFR